MADSFELTIDSEKIIGIFHEGKKDANACVISCHGLLASKNSPKYGLLAEELNKVGIPSVRFDFRGCGESDGIVEDSHISKRLRDLEAVIEYVDQNLGFNKFGLFGSSMGGYISFLKASKDPRISALVSLSSPFSMSELFISFGFNDEFYEIDGYSFGSPFLKDIKEHGDLTPEILGKIKCPAYIFHGDFDLLVPVRHATSLYDNLNTEKKIKIVNGGDHVFSNPYHLNEIINISVDWFVKHLISD